MLLGELLVPLLLKRLLFVLMRVVLQLDQLNDMEVKVMLPLMENGSTGETSLFFFIASYPIQSHLKKSYLYRSIGNVRCVYQTLWRRGFALLPLFFQCSLTPPREYGELEYSDFPSRNLSHNGK
uniref:Uncharacterized protein n=1 Tax=Anthurium amnicola TaxID=1678845 RepID=A0A1D1XHF9_9ARAE